MPDKKLTVKSEKVKALKTVKSSTATKLAASVVKKPSKSRVSGLNVDIYDVKGKVKGSMALPKEVFGIKVNPELMAQAVRVYLANQRRGTVSTKTRGEVQYSTRKVWRQKGTGRARHGGRGAPLFVKGGVAHGPKPRDYSLSLPQKMKQRALFSALSAKLTEGSVRVVDGFLKLEPKTKVMASTLANVGVTGKKQDILFVLPTKAEKTSDSTVKLARAARNIEGVSLVPAIQLNTYIVLKSRSLVFMPESLTSLTDHFIKGN